MIQKIRDKKEKNDIKLPQINRNENRKKTETKLI